MKILVIGGFAPSLIVFRGQLLARMVELGHEVTTAAADGNAQIRSQLAKLGVKYHEIPLHRAGMNPIADARAFTAMFRLIREIKPDLVLAYTVKPVIYGCLAARLARVPRIFAMITGLGYSFLDQDSLRRRALGILVRNMYRTALSGASGVFFQNPDDLTFFSDQQIIGHGIPTFVTNGSGVDLDHFTPAPPVIDPLIFLLVGRLLAEKGVRELVEAARLVKRVHPEVRFQILGWFDPHRACLPPEEVQAWNDEGVIEYLGVTNDVRPALAAASVFVLPSYCGEGTPRSGLEAMAMGRPIITTDTPGCRETVVEGENGFLVPARNARSLSAAISRFVANSSLVSTMGHRSREMAEERFGVHDVVQSILHVLLCPNTHSLGRP